MAYASLVSLSQTICTLLRDQDRYPISPHENQQIISIHEQSITFQAFLEDYSEKASSLEGRMRDVANEAEDTIEYFMWKQIQQRKYTYKLTAEPESTNEVSDLSGMCFDLKNLEKLAEEIESIAAELMEIKNRAGTEDVQQLTDSSSVATSLSSRIITASTSSKSDTAVVGFEDELMAIKERLCGESSKLQVIPIFGMGGIGKTTLAKTAYDDQLSVERFQIRAWITISQDYSAAQILSGLLASVGAECSEERDESRMAENVYKRIKGRSYLIVMDDVWSTEVWDDMRRIFPDDHNGSRIVITTRLSDVAAYPDSSSPLHGKRFMDADQSWNLLRQKVFPGGNCPPELEEIGKGIAISCRGLPLATVVIAGLLSTRSQTLASWENIARNVNEIVTANDEQFGERVLSWSYNHLPHYLRPCFLYMGIFPEDYEIRVSELIRLWVAEGFLKLSNGSKTCEEVAEVYLEDLIKRSLVLVTRRKSNGKIKSCGMHDLVRNLCIRKAEQEKFLQNITNRYNRELLEESIGNQRRISIVNSFVDFPENNFRLTIRTITSPRGDCLIISPLFSTNLRLLRILDIPDCSPVKVLELFLLRYLYLDHSINIWAVTLKLENLQTLIIGFRNKPLNPTLPPPFVAFFPLEIWTMRQLRHLVAYTCCLPDPEEETCTLENLQTLSVANFVCSERIAKMIPNLKKLGITYLGDKSFQNYNLENLVHLRHLEKLRLEVDESFPSGKSLDPVFPITLNKLTLSGQQRSWEDMGIIGSLPNLEVLKLRNHACSGCVWETSEGEFCQLKFLLIQRSSLKHWITDRSHFPSLKCLLLYSCICLREIPDGFGEIPTLELIEIVGLNGPLVCSAWRIREEQQQNWGNDALQVHIRLFLDIGDW